MARDAVIHRVNPYLLHDEQYYEILYAYTNEPDTLRQSRIAHTNIYPSPQKGDHVLIEAVLNIITEIKKKE
ncbi:MAG: hypothetical protein Q7R32_09460 [Dehalococcoidia bacterium]|nr:hypothetical protein [Dehalococcoidia bacterium]